MMEITITIETKPVKAKLKKICRYLSLSIFRKKILKKDTNNNVSKVITLVLNTNIWSKHPNLENCLALNI